MPSQSAVPVLPHAGQAPIYHANRDAHSSSRINALKHTGLLLYIFLRFLLGVFAVAEHVASAARERLCQFLGLTPCNVYGPRDSAIVIVGGDDDLGRHIALNFSQLGYTVFALCPFRVASAAESGVGGPSGAEGSNVSSLIQEWHQKMKRSGHSTAPWGLVAPIVLDMNSAAQRTRAVETVDAYCAAHNLHLVAVIVLPAPNITPSKPLRTARTGLNLSIWGDIVRQYLVEPISVVQDYVDMLATASGRVLLLLASGHQEWTPSPYTGTLLSGAQFLAQELDPLGIKVSTIVASPCAPVRLLPFMKAAGARTAGSFDSGGPGVCIWRIRNTIEEVLQHFVVDHEHVWCAVQAIVRSRYPKERYYVGLTARLQVVCDMIPSTVHLCVRSIVLLFS